MIYSMTGFARIIEQTEQARFSIEIKSVNHRFLEANCYLPETFNALELPLKELFRKKLERGRIDCRIQVQWQNQQQQSLPINDNLLQQLLNAAQHVSQKVVHAAPLSPIEVLSWPGIINFDQLDITSLQQTLTTLVQQAIDTLIAMRADEGATIASLILKRLDRMKSITDEIKPVLPTIIEQQKQRLLEKFEQAKIQIDPERLAQEMVLFAQKLDVSEELDRLTTHINAVEKLLAQGGRIGRKLDFLMQELNRETNTLGSKGLSTEITHRVVELKVLIEEMREQIQNIE